MRVYGHNQRFRQGRAGAAFALVGFLLMLGALFAGCALPANAEGEPAPDYSADLLGGDGSLALADLRGSVVLLNTWATWCEPCREEMPYLETLHQQLGGQSLRIIGVSVDQGGSDERVQEFARDLGVSFSN